MNADHDTHSLLRAFVDELARCGMSDACTSPGSRSTPLVAALAREPRLRSHSHIDERCAGFFALGLAKASRRPVAIACTSGTAAANLAPAVIEAHEARVPLIVMTADRPPELREIGAGQTIDQLKLYGAAAKWFFEVGLDAASAATSRWIRTLACRSYWTALEGRPGPVHLNFPLREPLVPAGEAQPVEAGRPDGRPWLRRWPHRASSDAAVVTLAPLLERAQRAVVVAGRCEREPGFASVVGEFAATAGLPLLADPLSGARSGEAAIAHYDLTLRDERFAGRHAPDVVLRVGDLPTSKALRTWLDRSDAVQVALDPEGAWQDPASVVSLSLAAGVNDVLAPLSGRVRAQGGWLASWHQADAAAAAALRDELDDEHALSEPRVARELAERLPANATLFVAASMPVRDIESFWPVLEAPPRVLSNRGANGIDGTVSSAFGAAAALGSDGPVAALVGDVALAHDIGGLLAASRLGLGLTIVLLNNDGGGIFDFLPVSGLAGVYEQHVATPHGLEFSHAARLYGLEYAAPADVEQLHGALDAALGAGCSTLIEIRTSRTTNVELHQRAADAVAAAIG